MHSLLGYGSDDDLDESPPPRKSAWQSQAQSRLQGLQESSQADVNYEEVQMDLSEDSSDIDGIKSDKKFEDSSPKTKRTSERYNNKSRDKYRRGRDCEEKYRSKESHRSNEYSNRDKHRERKSTRDDRDKGEKDYKDYKDKRRSRRSTSRDRRSKSPRRSETFRRRSRSRSKEKKNPTHSRRYDRNNARIGRIEKLGIDIKSTATLSQADLEGPNKNSRFYMPGITGRFSDQIQKRKLLWQKGKEPEKLEVTEKVAAPSTSGTNKKSGKLWERTTFAQDQDGKVANKFKRLMGIKDNKNDGIKPTKELIKKQEEMFTSMEAQYEVARTATHTMRGVGLGFGSFQR